MRTELTYLPMDQAESTPSDAVSPAEAPVELATRLVEAPRLQRVAYFRTGEPVAAGDYTCTYCGHKIHLSRERALPLCGSCDTDEFMASRPVAPTRPRGRQLVAA